MELLDKYLFNLPDAAVRQWVELVLLWVGFSTLVGMGAKVLVFGMARTATIVTVFLGFLGTIVGWAVADMAMRGLLREKYEGLSRIDKLLTPATFVFAFIGAMGLLFFFKLLSGPIGISKQGAKKP